MGGSNKQIDHAYHALFPREQYFEQHPEWYCLVDGKRNPYIDWWQMCYSILRWYRKPSGRWIST